jgi:hypothetical protein
MVIIVVAVVLTGSDGAGGCGIVLTSVDDAQIKHQCLWMLNLAIARQHTLGTHSNLVDKNNGRRYTLKITDAYSHLVHV